MVDGQTIRGVVRARMWHGRRLDYCLNGPFRLNWLARSKPASPDRKRSVLVIATRARGIGKREMNATMMAESREPTVSEDGGWRGRNAKLSKKYTFTAHPVSTLAVLIFSP
jgi:hypothetical protein